MVEEKTSLLEGYRVLDLTDERGHLCGKVLGDLGADVIKIEPPGGDPARNNGPFYHDIPDPQKSLYWFYGNLNKRGITLNIEAPDGREIFKKLAKRADFVIESFAPGYMKSLGLGYDELEKINAGIIMTSVTPFGQTGPYANYKMSDLIGVSMGGMTRLYGYFDTPPLRFAAPQFYFNSGIQGALGSVVALYHREMTGEGQYVDVSGQQATLLTLMLAIEIYDMVKVNYRGSGPFGVGMRPPEMGGPLLYRWVWPCKNGYAYLMVGGGAALGVRISTERLVAWANTEGYCMKLKDYDWLNLDPKLPQQEVEVWHAEFGEFLKTKTKEELFEYGVKNDLMLVPVTNLKDVVESPQLAARQFWVNVDHPELGEKLQYPGWPIKWTDLPPYQPQRRAPLIGEHNEEIYTAELGLSKDNLIMLKTRGVI